LYVSNDDIRHNPSTVYEIDKCGTLFFFTITSASLFLYIYIYIYIYMCVCVCVCVCVCENIYKTRFDKNEMTCLRAIAGL